MPNLGCLCIQQQRLLRIYKYTMGLHQFGLIRAGPGRILTAQGGYSEVRLVHGVCVATR